MPEDSAATLGRQRLAHRHWQATCWPNDTHLRFRSAILVRILSPPPRWNVKGTHTAGAPWSSSPQRPHSWGVTITAADVGPRREASIPRAREYSVKGAWNRAPHRGDHRVKRPARRTTQSHVTRTRTDVIARETNIRSALDCQGTRWLATAQLARESSANAKEFVKS